MPVRSRSPPPPAVRTPAPPPSTSTSFPSCAGGTATRIDVVAPKRVDHSLAVAGAKNAFGVARYWSQNASSRGGSRRDRPGRAVPLAHVGGAGDARKVRREARVGGEIRQFDDAATTKCLTSFEQLLLGADLEVRHDHIVAGRQRRGRPPPSRRPGSRSRRAPARRRPSRSTKPPNGAAGRGVERGDRRSGHDAAVRFETVAR